MAPSMEQSGTIAAGALAPRSAQQVPRGSRWPRRAAKARGLLALLLAAAPLLCWFPASCWATFRGAATTAGRTGSLKVQRRAVDNEVISGEDGLTYARFRGGRVEELEVDEEVPAPKVRKERRKPEEAEKKEAEPDVWYVGQIKSFAPAQGYGFIECEDTFKEFNTDIFLHKKQVEEAQLVGRTNKGDTVRFVVELNKNGRPQARKVELFKPEPKVDPNRTFVGRIKRYNAQLGFGFIASQETNRLFGTDVFLHKNQFDAAELQPNVLVTFTVEVSPRGQPQARNVAKYQMPSSASDEAEEVAAEASMSQ